MNSSKDSQSKDTMMTMSSLNSIFDSNSLMDENDKNNDVYVGLQSEIEKLRFASESAKKKYWKSKKSVSHLIGNLVILGISGVLFVKLSDNIRDNNKNFTSEIILRPFAVTSKFISSVLDIHNSELLTTYTGFIWGVVLGVFQPLLDVVSPECFTNKLFNFKSSKSENTIEFSTIIRSTIVLLGISFGLRHVDWESTSQASLAFSFLNPCVWLLLDSTIAGFISCTIFAFVATTLVLVFDRSEHMNDLSQILDYHKLLTDKDQLASMLFIASFFFCSLIIYGKLGRFLFS